jgi:two-component system, OmpR family, sensor histidine kinase VicK
MNRLEDISKTFSKIIFKVCLKIFLRSKFRIFIAKSIVEAHEDRIWAQNNRDGKGATFSFALPLSSNNDN